jgi:hypothetical protein
MRVSLRLLSQTLRIGYETQHLDAPLIIDRPELCQALPPGSPAQKTHAEALLQRAEMVADHRSGQPTLFTCCSHAATFDYTYKYPHGLIKIHFKAWIQSDRTIIVFISYCYIKILKPSLIGGLYDSYLFNLYLRIWPDVCIYRLIPALDADI